MAAQDVLRFRDALETNESFRNEVQAALQKGLREEPKADESKIDLAPMVELARQHGYTFTQEELKTTVKEHTGEGELTDEELEQVAGGGGRYEIFPGLEVDGVEILPKVGYGSADRSGEKTRSW